MSEHVTFRRGTPSDSRAAHDLFLASASDLARRLGTPWDPDPEEIWPRMRPLYERLATHAAEWWLAEAVEDGELVGYARSVERGGLFELSEFFVRPGRQSAGVGRELLSRAFPPGRGEVRAIVATFDVRAQARYYKAGTVARFPIAGLSGTARPDAAAGLEVAVEPMSEANLDEVMALERAVLEYPRDREEWRWILSQREGWVFRRDGETIGYGCVGAVGSGPVAALHPDDQVPILLQLESRAAALGRESLAVEVPMINAVAMRHLLARGYQIDQFLSFLMASRPFGRFDRFLGFSPPFVL